MDGSLDVNPLRLRHVPNNVLFNLAGYLVHVGVALLLTPTVLFYLGEVRYGVWALIVSLTGYYGIFDAGLRSGLTQFLTRSIASRDWIQARAFASTGFVALLACTGLIFVSSVILALSLPFFVAVPDRFIGEARICILIVGMASAVQFPLFVNAAVLTALERFDIVNVIGIATRVLTALATFFLLWTGYRLIAISIIVLAGNAFDYGLRAIVARRLLPQLSVRTEFASWAVFRSMITFGTWNALVTVGTRILAQSGIIVVGCFMPLAAVTRFALAANLVQQFSNLFVPIGQVFYPAAARLDAVGDRRRLRELYLNSTKVLTLAACGAGLIAGLLADDFFHLWIGNRLIEQSQEFPGVASLFICLILGAVFTASQRIGYQVLTGIGKVRTLAILFMGEAILSAALCLGLTDWYGLYGATISFLIGAAVFQAGIHPLVICHELQIPFREYLAIVIRGPAVSILIALYPLYFFHRILPSGDWFRFLFHALALSAAAVFLLAACHAVTQERARYTARRNQLEALRG